MTAVDDVLKPVIYADIFDYPLTDAEIHQFLECQATPAQVAALLERARAERRIMTHDGYYYLPGRAEILSRRHERKQAADKLWPEAIRYGRWIAHLPFVRMVSVTGSLAVDNLQAGAEDIDYFIITAPGRLWLCRTLIIAIVRYSQRRGVWLCPNYLVTEARLAFEANLVNAREIVQMVPLYGTEAYQAMWRHNPWIQAYLPQGTPAPCPTDALARGRLKRWAERLLTGPLGNALEWLLQRYYIARHTRQAQQNGHGDTVEFSAEVCKGHYDAHHQQIAQTYQHKLKNGYPVYD